MDFPSDPVVKNLPTNAGDPEDMSSIPRLRRSPGEGNSNPLQYSCLGNPMDRGTQWATICGASKSRARWLTKHKYHPYNWSLPFTLYSNVLFCFSLTKKSEWFFKN